MKNNNLNLVLISGIFIFVFLFISLLLIDYKIKLSLIQIAKAKVQVSGAKKINQVVNEKIVSQIEYNDIVYVHKDDKGRIALIQPNTIVLNQIMTTAVMEISDTIEKMQEDNIDIPIGQITGSNLLAGYGPKIKVKIIPSGEVYVEVLNKFDQAGINQTRHLIYFKVNNKLKVAVPFLHDIIEVTTIIPLAETIVVGDVPDTYVDFKGAYEMLFPFIDGR